MKLRKYLSSLSLLACAGVTVSQGQLSSGLIGYWEFEQDLVNSATTNGGAGIHNGAIVLEDGSSIDPNTSLPYEPFFAAGPSGAFGDALDISYDEPGEGEGLRIDHSNSGEAGYVDTFDAALNAGAGMTVSVWAQGIPDAWGAWISKNGEAAGGYQLRRLSSDSVATFTLRETLGDDDIAGSVDIAAGQPAWVHYVGTWDSATGDRKLYINGVEDTAFAITGDLPDTATVNPAGPGPFNASAFWLTIGTRHIDADPTVFESFFTGFVDDVAMWDRPLSLSEVRMISANPVSAVLSALDDDLDGLSNSEEATLGTDPDLADTDSDGVDDFDEVQAGSDPINDDDFDDDGLLTSQETSGSENPWTGNTSGATPGDTTDWRVADSDGDGVDDGDELSSLNGSVTNPNNADTDGDGWSDGSELSATPASDPTDALSIPSVSTGLIGYWQFENDLVDASGAHVAGTHDGAQVGTVAYTSGPSLDFGQSLDLDGSNGVAISNTISTDTNYEATFDTEINAANAMTVSFWARGSLGRWSPYLCKYGENAEGFQVRRRNSTAETTFTLRSTEGEDDPVAGNATATESNWVHYLAVWDGSNGGTRKLYINGVEDAVFAGNVGADASVGGPGNASGYQLTFGMRDNGESGTGTYGNYFNGELDDVAIWSRALTASEAVLLANNPLSVVITSTDTDLDGLFDDDEINIHGTNPSEPDSDFDGVNDFDEVQVGSNPNADNDFDMDGLLNSVEVSGSANPWTGNILGDAPGDSTGWNVTDSDFDGVSDGDEISLDNGFITNPNVGDTDGDGWSDGSELSANPSSDPTDALSVPVVAAGDLVAGFDQRYIGATYGAGSWPDSAGTANGTATNAEGFTLTTTPNGAAAVANATSGLTNGNVISFTRTSELGAAGQLTIQSVIRIDDTTDDRSGPYALNQTSGWGGLYAGANADGGNALRGGNVGNTGTNGTTINGSGGAAVAAGTWGVYTVTIDSTVATPQMTATFTDLNTGVELFTNVVDSGSVGTGTLGFSNDGVLFGGEQGGGASATNGWGGAIADVVVYNSLLTPANLAANFGEFQELYGVAVSPGGTITIVAFGFNESDGFAVEAIDLDPALSYQLTRTSDLVGLSDQVNIGSPFTGGTSNTFVDATPPAGAYFYIIVGN
ncbi:MAG: LamG-like jellyroll fold domain-containing protein [Opitutaceae bacterium]